MSLDLTGVNAKLSRAKEHTQAVKDEVAAWFNTKPYSITKEANTDFTRWALVVHIQKAADLLRWTLIIGDAVNNLRSALDHLVYTIAVHESGSNPPPDETILAFPICDTVGDFKDSSRRRIKSLTDAVRTTIESVQPYNRPHPTLPSLLSILRDFNNTDKHKLLRLAYGATSEGRVTFQWEGSRADHPVPIGGELAVGELNDGAEVMAFTFDRPAPDMQCQYDIQIIIALWHGGKAGITPRIDRDDFAAILTLLTEEVETVIQTVVAAVKV